MNNQESLAPTVASNTLAYVRPVRTNKGEAYVVFSTDGTPLATFASFDAAFYAAKQHDLEPATVH